MCLHTFTCKRLIEFKNVEITHRKHSWWSPEEGNVWLLLLFFKVLGGLHLLGTYRHLLSRRSQRLLFFFSAFGGFRLLGAYRHLLYRRSPEQEIAKVSSCLLNTFGGFCLLGAYRHLLFRSSPVPSKAEERIVALAVCDDLVRTHAELRME